MARIVKARLRGSLPVDIRAREFEWLGDEPEDKGGTDGSPTPYEQLLGSLASCTAITLRLYADYKGIELDGVDVEAEFARVPASPPSTARIEQIITRVTLHGRFDEAQRKRLAQIAERCPVHKTLRKGLDIADSVTFAE